ncbi:TM2 domain-containing protein [Christiangramia gaetbulicola]|uniref:TM2 domain-containing protein n=1 Tax=Christiangramia gaetbulicola TaxID=703340 RepID=A0A2T6ANA2_9FLAO|nr:TM2 domain-containing protein [Christiangramia gaetbulicola]PTX45270.1 TM2 domain-containing protein [Christiangramia gaetbulicola]
MKLKLLLSIFAFALATNLSYASFPVQRTLVESETVTAQAEEEGELFSPAALAGTRSQGVAILLLVFLGFAAGHRWYLGSPWYWNILFIITAGGLGIWWIVDLIGIITKDYAPKNGTYKDSFF